MNVSQLFDKLMLIADIEIVVTFFPKVLPLANQWPRRPLLQ